MAEMENRSEMGNGRSLLQRSRRIAWIAVLVADVGLLLWCALAALVPQHLPGPSTPSIVRDGYEGFTGGSWPELASSNPGAADFTVLVFRMFGVYGTAFSLMAIAIAATAFRRGERWAWWALLVGNTLGYGGPMTYDLVVHAIGPFEMTEYLGIGLVYAALAVTWPGGRAARPRGTRRVALGAATTLGLVLFASPASASPPDVQLHVDPTVDDCEVRFASELTQASYHRFVREFGSVSAFKQMGSPLVVGTKGVSLGIEYMAFRIDETSDAWNDTFTHPDATHWLGGEKEFPKLKVRVGIGRHTDIGAFYTMNPESNYGWLGIDAKHALLRQDLEMPVTVAVRGAYTKTLFVGDMGMHALSADVSVGRTFKYRLTPYLGVGSDAVLAGETSPMVELNTEHVATAHAFAGLEVAWRKLIFGAEVQYSTIPSVQAQLAWGF